jgi:hypothetical protein
LFIKLCAIAQTDMDVTIITKQLAVIWY